MMPLCGNAGYNVLTCYNLIVPKKTQGEVLLLLLLLLLLKQCEATRSAVPSAVPSMHGRVPNM